MTGPDFLTVGEGHYRLTALEQGLMFDVDRLRRERHELFGELTVYCDLAGSKTVEGALSIGTFNLSSPTARTQRAKLLREQSETEIDFLWLLEQLCNRTILAERQGVPSRPLHLFDRPGAGAELQIDGLRLLREHPTIWFGDGGSLKSYLALYGAGRLAAGGMHVLFADWELGGGDHRDRLERLFGTTMPTIDYLRCEKPLVEEVDRLQRSIERQGSEFVILDSITPACLGPPESAEVASAYMRAVRQLKIGSLHLAHVSKAENGDQKPFGSAFWHNLARSTSFLKVADNGEGGPITVGVFNRKANLTRLYPAVGFQFAFTETATRVTPVKVADVGDLAVQLTVRQRMTSVLKRGAMTADAVAEEIEKDVETVRRTARRYREQFVVLPGGRLGLVDHRILEAD